MSISLRKLAARLIAAVMTVSAVTAANAAALEQPVAVLSSSLNASVGTVLTSDEVTNAAKAYSICSINCSEYLIFSHPLSSQ